MKEKQQYEWEHPLFNLFYSDDGSEIPFGLNALTAALRMALAMWTPTNVYNFKWTNTNLEFTG